jgi:hypothetical protein
VAANFPTSVPTILNYTAASEKGVPYDVFQQMIDEIIAMGSTFVSGRARASAFHNTTQSLTDSTETILNFNSEDFDVGGVHDTATNNSRMTVPANNTGIYLAIGSAGFAPNATGFRYVVLLKNGTTKVAMTTTPSNTAGSGSIMQVSACLSLAAADYIEVIAFQSSGGPLNAGHITAREQQNSLQLLRLW